MQRLLPLLMILVGCAEFVEDHHDHYHEPANTFSQKEQYGTVGDVISGRGCSTGPLKKLDLQIAKEMSCMSAAPLSSIEQVTSLRLGEGVRPHLQKDAALALIRASEELGSLMLTSGWRSVAQQHVLKSWQGRCGVSLAAQPGRSHHQSGLAIDTGDYRSRRTREVLKSHGFRWYCDDYANGRLAGCNDPVHFEYGGGDDLRDISILAFQKLWNRNNPQDQIEEDGFWGPTTASKLNESPIAGFPSIASCETIVSDAVPGGDSMKCDDSAYEASFGYEACETEDAWRCACSADLGDTISQVCRGGVWINHQLSPVDCSRCNDDESEGCRGARANDISNDSAAADICGDASLDMSESGDPCQPHEENIWRCACTETIGDVVSQVCRDGEWTNYRLSPRDCGRCDGDYSSGCEP